MKVLVWHNQHGAAQLYLPPEHPDQPPATQGARGGAASIQGKVWTPAVRDLMDQGEGVSFDDWAQQLTEQYPYHGEYWTYEDVPDGLTAQQALSFVRDRDASQALGG